MRAIAGAFAMTDAVWQRHANPWSVWTRVPILPLLCLAIWARAWIGWWCLIPVAMLVAWTWINPRAFPPPARTDSWASRAVLGERIWLDRARAPVPRRLAFQAQALALAGLAGMVPVAWGLWAFALPALLAGLALSIGAKLWFLHIMVRLYDDEARRSTETAGAGATAG